jgi:hypothetical protein
MVLGRGFDPRVHLNNLDGLGRPLDGSKKENDQDSEKRQVTHKIFQSLILSNFISNYFFVQGKYKKCE